MFLLVSLPCQRGPIVGVLGVVLVAADVVLRLLLPHSPVTSRLSIPCLAGINPPIPPPLLTPAGPSSPAGKEPQRQTETRCAADTLHRHTASAIHNTLKRVESKVPRQQTAPAFDGSPRRNAATTERWGHDTTASRPQWIAGNALDIAECQSARGPPKAALCSTKQTLPPRIGRTAAPLGSVAPHAAVGGGGVVTEGRWRLVVDRLNSAPQPAAAGGTPPTPPPPPLPVWESSLGTENAARRDVRPSGMSWSTATSQPSRIHRTLPQRASVSTSRHWRLR